MKLTTKLCHSHLMSMLLMPDKFHNAVQSYVATPPNMEHEGIIGYMEVDATFHIKDLQAFTDLWYNAYKMPSDRSEWYHKVKSQMLGKC